jgi:hypothetical protein
MGEHLAITEARVDDDARIDIVQPASDRLDYGPDATAGEAAVEPAIDRIPHLLNHPLVANVLAGSLRLAPTRVLAATRRLAVALRAKFNSCTPAAWHAVAFLGFGRNPCEANGGALVFRVALTWVHQAARV